jgi:hypothetical protein
MRGFLAVFEREVVERRLLVLAALFLGLVPLVTPWLPGLEQRGGPEVRSGTALALALCFSLGLALILGATVVARDLAERRLGFYFSRPVTGWAIWAGKLAGAAALALGAGLLILLPATAWERHLDFGGWWGSLLPGRGLALDVAGAALLWIACLVILVLAGHAAGVALRSRAPWLVLDFAGLGLVGWLGWAAARRLGFSGAFGAAAVAAIGLLAAALLALLAAGAAQVLGGRTDIRRGHRLLSLTLWGTLLVAGLAAQGYASWVLAAEPEDLDSVGVTGVPFRGPWIATSGTARHRAEYQPEFLLDTSSGRFVRSRTIGGLWSPQFSADGRWALWLEPQGGDPPRQPYELFRLDLRDPRSRPERTRLSYSRWVSRFALSPDSGRVAVFAGRRLTIEELPSGRLLASAELPREMDWEAFPSFVDSGRVRIFGFDLFTSANAVPEPAALEVGEIRVAGGGLVRTARIEGVERFQVSADGRRLLARRRSDQRFVVLDAATGAAMAELPFAGERSRASFLADGRIALVSATTPPELRIFSPAFAPERTFQFKTAMAVRLGGQPAPDRLVVAIAPRGPDTPRWDLDRTLILDLAAGTSRRFGRGLVPAAGPRWGPESVASRLFLTAENQLVEVDPATGRQRLVAGARRD